MGTVNTKTPRKRGELKKALVSAGVELLNEGGLSALTLRKCAARAGVSHAAPAHYFDGLKGLLTAIVAEGFRKFTQTMIEQRDGAHNDPHARLAAVCAGYLTFARNNEAMSTLMFMVDEIDTDDAEFRALSSASYQVLANACAPFNSGAAGQKGTEVLIWSLVQGYASLARFGMVDAEVVPFDDILLQLDLRLK
ncbi:MAG: TetR/AcrR family transcriptional regulator [Paracoccaceae bacterium]